LGDFFLGNLSRSLVPPAELSLQYTFPSGRERPADALDVNKVYPDLVARDKTADWVVITYYYSADRTESNGSPLKECTVQCKNNLQPEPEFINV
jgi:hypothetical protein